MIYEYIKNHFITLGINIKLEDINLDLPKSYTFRYELSKVILEDLELLFIKEKRSAFLESFVEQEEFISNKIHLPYVLVCSSISEENRIILIKSIVPYMDTQRNMFMPMLGLNLVKDVMKILMDKFTPSEQFIMISVLLNEHDNINIDQISGVTNISKPTIYRCFKKFIDNGLLAHVNNQYILTDSKIDIFNESLVYFINPIHEVVYVKSYDQINDHCNVMLLDAGLRTLSKSTNLVNNEETKVIDTKAFNNYRNKNKQEIFNKNILNLKTLEIYKYDPNIQTNNDSVDPISLYLSLEYHNDPRVQK